MDEVYLATHDGGVVLRRANKTEGGKINASLTECIVRARRVEQPVDERRLLVKNTDRQTDGQRDAGTDGNKEEEKRGCNIDESCSRRQKAQQSISSQSLSHCSHRAPTHPPN